MKKIIFSILIIGMLVGISSCATNKYISEEGYWDVNLIPMIIPEGTYVINMIIGSQYYSEVQMRNNNKWFIISSGNVNLVTTGSTGSIQNGITVVSDGVNFRVIGSEAVKHRMYYRKF